MTIVSMGSAGTTVSMNLDYWQVHRGRGAEVVVDSQRRLQKW